MSNLMGQRAIFREESVAMSNLMVWRAIVREAPVEMRNLMCWRFIVIFIEGVIGNERSNVLEIYCYSHCRSQFQ